MQQQLYCPRCHQPVQPGQRFCNNCDFDLTSETPAHKTQPATGSPLVPLTCPSCGASLPLPATNAEYLICPYCGKTFYLRRSANGVSLELVRQVEQDLAKQLRQQQTEQQLQMLKMEEEQVLNELTALKGMPQTPQRDQSIAALTKRLKQLEREIHWQKPQTKIGDGQPPENANRRGNPKLFYLILGASLPILLICLCAFLGMVINAQNNSTVVETAVSTPLSPSTIATGSDSTPQSELQASDFAVSTKAPTTIEPGNPAGLEIEVINKGTRAATSINIVITGDLFQGFALKNTAPIALADHSEKDGRHLDYGPLGAGQTTTYTLNLLAQKSYSRNWAVIIYANRTIKLNEFKPNELNIP